MVKLRVGGHWDDSIKSERQAWHHLIMQRVSQEIVLIQYKLDEHCDWFMVCPFQADKVSSNLVRVSF
jgi:hypothetical protein